MSSGPASYPLIGDLVDMIVDRLRKVLPELIRESIERSTAYEPPCDSRPPENSARQMYGLDPYKLYPVSFVAKRWNYSKSAVYRIPDIELPRVEWNGGEIRYRGRDILEYEGIDVDSRLNERQSGPEDNSSDRSPHRSKTNGHKTSTNAEESDGRPYEEDLPEL